MEKDMKKKYEITPEQLKRFKTNLDDIERWRGEAYQNDDEVGVAMQDLKTMLSTIVYGDTTEVCPHCEEEQETNKPNSPCPNCGKTLIACSMCTMEYADGCAGCTDGTSKNYDVELILE